MRIILVLIVSLSLVNCTGGHVEPIELVPEPPPELSQLPSSAKIRCYSDPFLDQGGVSVWEKPGVDRDIKNNSNPTGDRGKWLGELLNCTPVTVLDYSWSRTDQEYYLLIQSSSLKGWISYDRVTLN